MKFGKQLQLLMTAGWEKHYVLYKELKQIVSEIEASEAAFNAALAEQFLDLLRTDLEKVKEFFGQQIAQLNDNFESAKSQVLRKEINKADDPVLAALCESLERLKLYVQLNNQGFEKIIKKIHKRTKHVITDHQQAGYIAVMTDCTEHLVKLSSQLKDLLWKLPTLDGHAEGRLLVADTIRTVANVPKSLPNLEIESCPLGEITTMYVQLGSNSLGAPRNIPVIVARGRHAGPVLGITACIHGNELNGIPLIHSLLGELDCNALSGTIVAVPVVNIEGFQRLQRGFADGVDLNRIMPGKEDGTSSQQFAAHFMKKIVRKLNYLVDLHTASFGRVNSLYVRADMTNPVAFRMAMLLKPQIIVHNTSPDGSLRYAAALSGVHAVTLEIGNPLTFHVQFIKSALAGLVEIMSYLNMLPKILVTPMQTKEGVGSDDRYVFMDNIYSNPAATTNEQEAAAAPVERILHDLAPVVCSQSHWIYTKHGGILYVIPKVTEWISKGQLIAQVVDLFGHVTAKYYSDTDGIIVGKSINPVCQSGDRILHVGVVKVEFPEVVHDGHE